MGGIRGGIVIMVGMNGNGDVAFAVLSAFSRWEDDKILSVGRNVCSTNTMRRAASG